MTKKSSKRLKYPDGGMVGPGEETPLTAKEIREKYKGNPYVGNGRELWGQQLSKTFPGTNNKVKDVVINAAKYTGIDPSLLYSSAMEEGVQLELMHPDDASEAYVDWADRNKNISGNYPVDGFYNYGLDTFGDNYAYLEKKGYLPKDFDKKFKVFDAVNELNQPVKTAAFVDNQSAFMAKAAMMKQAQDYLNNYATKQHLNLTDKQRDFFTLAGYNSGLGNIPKIITSYKNKGYLKDDKFLDPSFKPASWAGVYTNVQRRLQNRDVLLNEGYFKDGGKMPDGGNLDPDGDGDNDTTILGDMDGDLQPNPFGIQKNPFDNIQTPVNPNTQNLFRINEKGDIVRNDVNPVPLAHTLDTNKNLLGFKNVKDSGHYVDSKGQILTKEDQANKLNDTNNFNDKRWNNIELASTLGVTGINALLNNNSEGQMGRSSYRNAIMNSIMQSSRNKNPYSGGTGSQAIMKDGGNIPAEGQGLNITDGGKAKLISSSDHSNPMIEFTGKTHEEGGIGLNYGGNEAEVENKEVGWIDSKGSLNIFGKLKVPGTNQTFRKAAKDIAKQEDKVDSKKALYTKILNNADESDRYQSSAISTAKVMFKSLDKQSKQIAEKKEAMASYQDLILSMTDKQPHMRFGGRVEYKEGGEIGDDDVTKLAEAIGAFESSGKYDALGKRVTKGPYKGQQALGKYQVMPDNLPEWSKEALGREVSVEEFLSHPEIQDKIARHRVGVLYKQYKNPKDVASAWFSGGPLSKDKGQTDDNNTNVPDYVSGVMKFYDGSNGNSDNKPSTDLKDLQPMPEIKVTGKGFSPVHAGAPDNSQPVIYTPYGTGAATHDAPPPIDSVNIGNNERKRGVFSPLDINQITPELMAIANNKQKSVNMPSFQPQLGQTVDVSYQSGRNNNQASFNQLVKVAEQTGNMDILPELAAKKYQADNALDVQEIQGNAAQKLGVYNKNTDLLNEAQKANLSIFDTQADKQAQAKFNTDQQFQSALTSISGKVQQNKLENVTYNAYANLFKNYGFDKNGNVTFNPDKVSRRFTPGEAQQFGMVAAQQGVDKVINKTKDGNNSTTTINNSDLSDLIQARKALKEGVSLEDVLTANPGLKKYNLKSYISQ